MRNEEKRIVALIQARMGSSRLPGKVMANISGHPVIWHIWNRLKSVSEINEVVVATSLEHANDILEEFCISEQIPCFRGSESEVLDRFYQAAIYYRADAVVRITGDCPLIDPPLVRLVIQTFLKSQGKIDYVSLATGAGIAKQKVNKFPDGTDTEVIAFDALKRAWIEAKDPLDRGESVTSYIWRNKELFQCESLFCKKDLSNLRWTLDRPEDLEFIRKIYEKLYRSGTCFSMSEILHLLETNASLAEINASAIGKEGYEKYYEVDYKNKTD